MKRVGLIAASAAEIVQFTKQDLTALQTLGCEVHVICPLDRPSVSSEAMHMFNETFPNLIWHDFLFWDRLPSLWKNASVFKRLMELLKELQLDLLHCYSTTAGYYGRKVAKQLQIPCFYTAHDFRVYHGCHWTERLYFGTIEKKYSKNTAVFLPACAEDKTYVEKHLHAEKVGELPLLDFDYTYYVTPHRSGVEMRKELQIPEDATVLLSVGALRMQKRLRIVLQAMARLEDQKNVHYVICGDGPDMSFLKQLSDKLRLIDRVHFLGYRTDIPDLLGMADIFCMPSCRETSGIAAMEACAAGLPLITVRVHGLKTYVEQKEGAFCLKGDLVYACADAITKLCENRLLRKQMGAHNRATAKAFVQEEENLMLRVRSLYRTYLQ